MEIFTSTETIVLIRKLGRTTGMFLSLLKIIILWVKFYLENLVSRQSWVPKLEISQFPRTLYFINNMEDKLIF